MEKISKVLQPAQRPTSGLSKTLPNSPRSNEGAGSGRQAASPTPAQCTECGGVGYFRLDVPMGHPQFGKLIPCECQAENKLSRLQRLSGLTEAERSVRLADIVAPAGSDTALMVQAAQAFVSEPAGFLTIHGSTGNAKTAVMHGIVNELVKAGVEAVYITAFDLIGYIRAAFDDKHDVADVNAHERLKRLERVQVLCLDELDKVKWSDWVQEQITDLIDVRYRHGLNWETGTVVAMNTNPESLPAFIYSRLRDGRNMMVENRDADVRPGME